MSRPPIRRRRPPVPVVPSCQPQLRDFVRKPAVFHPKPASPPPIFAVPRGVKAPPEVPPVRLLALPKSAFQSVPAPFLPRPPAGPPLPPSLLDVQATVQSKSRPTSSAPVDILGDEQERRDTAETLEAIVKAVVAVGPGAERCHRPR